MILIPVTLLIFSLIFLQAFYYKRHAFRHLDYQCYFSAQEAYEGDEIELVEEIANRKLLPIPWLRSDFNTSKWLEFAETRSVITDQTRYVVSFFMVKSHCKVIRRWKVKCLRRGVFAVDRVSLGITDLLGVHMLSQTIYPHAAITVLPSPVSTEELDYSVCHPVGEVEVRRHLIADPFLIAGTRQYMPGDPMNHINWTATARSQELMVRQFSYSSNPSLTVILNIQSREFEHEPESNPVGVENGIRFCAGLFCSALDSAIPVQFLSNVALNGKSSPVVTTMDFGTEHIQNLIRLLSVLPLEKCAEFSEYLFPAVQETESADIIIVTNFLCDAVLSLARSRTGVRIFLTGPVDPEIIPTDCTVVSLYEFFSEGRRFQ